METRANYVVVGAFTIAVIAAAFVFIYWIARVDTGGDTARLDVVIEGSVTGLGVGSMVKFNGIDVGKVTRLRFDPEDPKVVIAQTMVNRNLPITSSTKATLGFTGLTGIAYIEFEGGDMVKSNVFDENEPGQVPTVKADPSAVNNLLATAQDIFDRTDRVLSDLEGFVTDVREPLSHTLTNASKFSDALAKNSDNIDKFLEGIGDTGKSLANLGDKLDGTIKGVEKLVAAVDPTKVETIVGNVETFTSNLNSVSGNIADAAKNVQGVASELSGVGGRINSTIDRVDSVVAAVKPDDVSKTLGNIASASETAKSAMAEIAAATEGLGARKDDIQGIVDRVAKISQDADAFMSNARGASDDFKTITASADKVMKDLQGIGGRVDGSLDRIDKLLDAVPPDQITKAVNNITSTSDAARAAIDEIASATTGLGERNEQIKQIMDRVDTISQNADTFMSNAKGASEDFKTMTSSATQVLDDLKGVGSRVDESFSRIDAILQAVPPDRVRSAVDDIAKAGDSARKSLENVEQLTAGLGDRKKDVDDIITNVSQLSERLNAASVRVDGILAKADKLLDTEGGDSLVDEARQTLAAYREVADTLNKRINAIAGSLQNFSDKGLRNVEGLVNDTRRSVGRIENAIGDLENNPQRLIFGGEGSVKTYDGRTRR